MGPGPLFDLVVANYARRLALYAGVARSDCAIHVGEIRGRLGGNCRIRLVNKCNSNAAVSFTLLLESLEEVLDLVAPADKRAIGRRLGVDFDTFRSQTTDLERRCRAEAYLSNDLDVQTIHLGECDSPVPLEFQFVNSGSAVANCGLAAVFRELAKRETGAPVQARVPVERAEYWLVAAAFLAVAACLLVVALLRATVTLRYRYAAYLDKRAKKV
ncbi:ORF046 [Saltwater crocodilepox virus]|nr:ORF046 [Saltwater crocodilepox virus]QGT49054.1 ORF046 [Saltwater crocodilepox virus]